MRHIYSWQVTKLNKHFKEGGTDYKRIDEEAQVGIQCACTSLSRTIRVCPVSESQSESESYYESPSKRVAKLAVAALHKLSKPKKELEGKVKSGAKSKSVLEKIRERRSVNDEIEAPLSNTDIFKKSKLNPNYKLARQLRKG